MNKENDTRKITEFQRGNIYSNNRTHIYFV